MSSTKKTAVEKVANFWFIIIKYGVLKYYANNKMYLKHITCINCILYKLQLKKSNSLLVNAMWVSNAPFDYIFHFTCVSLS